MSVIRTPHAAVKIWNFDDRINVNGTTGPFNKVSEQIISTVSLISIQTSKSKGDPVGSFQFVLAPTRNWVATLTPGSWCVIMMSNKPIQKEAFEKADSDLVKMVGRIETVRIDVTVDETGARQTRYLVSGQDWGSVFNNIVYVDQLIQDPRDQSKNQGNALYIQFMENVFGPDNSPLKTEVLGNLQTILSIIGGPLKLPKTDRLAKATHDIDMPYELVQFFKFIDGEEKVTSTTEMTKFITVVGGSLNKGIDDDFDDTVNTGSGWLDPFKMVGQHSLWSILQDNANYAINEMYPEIFWSDIGPQLLLYNRVKPFSFQKEPIANIDLRLRSKFQNVRTHRIETETVISVNAGINWQDKFNFVEIKPDINELQVFGQIYKQRSQAYQGNGNSANVFNREGFKPLIFSIRQLPFDLRGDAPKPIFEETLQGWVNLLQEWYFDCHRLLNGRLTMTGITSYLPVGDNILVDAGIVGVTPNYNSASPNANKKIYLLAHIESVQHNFIVGADGARQYQTTVQFVRGIFVDENKNLIGEGTLDTLASSLQFNDSKNQTVITPEDPKSNG